MYQIRHLRISKYALLALMSVLSDSVVCVADEAKTSQQRAGEICSQTFLRFIGNRNVDEAQRGYKYAIAADPAYAPAYFNLGVLDEAKGDWGTAEQDFRRFSQLTNDPQRLKLAMGEIRKLQRSVSNSDPASIRASQYLDAIGRGNVFVHVGLLKQAISTAAAAAKLDDSRCEAYLLAADALSRAKRYNDAEQFLNKAYDRANGTVRQRIVFTLGELKKEQKYIAGQNFDPCLTDQKKALAAVQAMKDLDCGVLEQKKRCETEARNIEILSANIADVENARRQSQRNDVLMRADNYCVQMAIQYGADVSRGLCDAAMDQAVGQVSGKPSAYDLCHAGAVGACEIAIGHMSVSDPRYDEVWTRIHRPYEVR